MSNDMVDGVDFFMMDELVAGDQIELEGNGTKTFLLVSLSANHYPGSTACCIISDGTEIGGADKVASVVQLIGWDMAYSPDLINWAPFRANAFYPGRGRLICRRANDEFEFISVNRCTIKRGDKVLFERSAYEPQGNYAPA